MSVLKLKSLLSTLNEHGVRYIVIGGIAVAAHGFVRGTKDLNVVPDLTAENVKRLSAALVALEATLPRKGNRRYLPERDEAQLHKGASLTAGTTFGQLDIVQRIPGVPSWVDLEKAAVETDLQGVPVRVCSLDHLRQMKRARAGDQDLVDLKELENA